MPRIYNRKSYVGEKFGRLTVLTDLEDIKKGNLNIRLVATSCDCGARHTVRLHSLTNSTIESCGCLRLEKAKQTCIDRNTTHNDSGTKEHVAWKAMVKRCYNDTGPTYKYYGERGIKVHENWLNNYKQFLLDMGRAPDDSSDWSVGRKDNNADYSASNCVWEVWDNQARNKGMQTNNTSGFTGVSKRFKRGILHFQAYWVDSGVRHERLFSAQKYGTEEALALAVECRNTMINEMNTRGAGYSPEHGLPRKVKGLL
jgi:hypothetical protein